MQLQDEYADTSQKYLQPDFDTELLPSNPTHQQHLCKSTMTSTSLPTSSFHPGSANSILTLQGDRQSNSVSVASGGDQAARAAGL